MGEELAARAISAELRSELRLAAFNLINVVLHIYGARAAAGAGVAADTLDAVRSLVITPMGRCRGRHSR